MEQISERKLASISARKIMAGEISFKQFVDDYPEDSTDKEIEELFSLIEHQPKQGGFLGLSKFKFDEYNQKIERLIEKLMED